MKKWFFILSGFLISAALLCSSIVLNSCRQPDTVETISENGTETSESVNISTVSETTPQVQETENIEGSTLATEPDTETGLSEDEILAGMKEILSQEIPPYIALAFLDKNISTLSTENANKAFNDLEELLKIYEEKYTEELLSGEDGRYQQLLNDFASEYQKDLNGELTKEQVLNIWDDKLSEMLIEVFDSGYKLVNFEGSWFPIINYGRLLTYVDYLADDYRDYVLFSAMESDKVYAKDAALKITWDELAVRVLIIEDFLMKYPESKKYTPMGDKYFNYLMSYFIGMSNTPAFDYDTNKFRDEVLISYNNTVSNDRYKGFFTAKLISEYLDVISKNNGSINDTVRKFIREAYIRVEEEYGIANPYTGT